MATLSGGAMWVAAGLGRTQEISEGECDMKTILEIRPAEGGEDSVLFAKDLLSAYKRLCERFGWRGNALGALSLEITGDDLCGLEHEAGGHRIQRVPPTERRGRVHTSTVTVAVISGNQAQARADKSSDFKIEWYSGSGAGGEHRNKRQNSCRVTHIPTGLVRKAETRSRENSYRLAMEAISEALNERAQSAAHASENAIRRGQVGSGMRGDKRRTYRFQEDSVVDHVTGRRARCSYVMRGSFNLLWS
jgi:peptide chain release factor 1